MGKKVDLAGMVNGHLTVLRACGTNSAGKTLWECKCTCGNTVIEPSYELTPNRHTDCGCIKKRKPKFIDLTGMTFNRLKVIRRSKGQKDNRVFWDCLCECGNQITAHTKQLMNGWVKSCGCQPHLKNVSKDLTGMRFNHFLVIEPTSEKNGPDGQYWKCRCDCGNECIVCSYDLTTGRKKHCGCLISLHGKSKTRLYKIYANMKRRCYKANSVSYQNYGGRGIRICDEWLGVHGFEHFYDWSMSHGYADDLSIDRINVNGDYEPSNCRWADAYTQANNKRNNRKFIVDGVEKTVGELSKEYNIPYAALHSRLERGHDIESALRYQKTAHSNTGIIGITWIEKQKRFVVNLYSHHVGSYRSLEDAKKAKEEFLCNHLN